MVFRVERVSTVGEDVPPCDEAVAVNRFGTINYYIEINSLKELLQFCKEYGGIVLREQHITEDIPSIIIYDDYME